jgi:signal peptidase I
MKDVSRLRWIKFSIVAVLYALWVLWLGSYWLIIGLAVIFDIYITKKVPWDFWKKTKDGSKPSAVIEWIDALVFALVAVYFINVFLFQNYKIPTSSLEKSLLVGDHLFVSKVSYGPRVPNTPISFPLVQNTFPVLNTKSYTEWPSWGYKRLKGFGTVQRGDIVVFNFPAGDTIAFNYQNPDIYNLKLSTGNAIVSQNPALLNNRSFGSIWERNQFLKEIGKSYVNNNLQDFGEIMYRPVDRRENFVKRCVAVAGDNFEIRHNQVYINNVAVKNPENLQHIYNITTDGNLLNDLFFENFKISQEDRDAGGTAPHYYLPLTKAQEVELKNIKSIISFQMDETPLDSTGFSVFPHSPDYPWSRDNYGPLWIPKKGATVELTLKNLVIYDRIITAYEGNKLEVKNGQIYINGSVATSYTFKMDYYFMLGDNRHKSADSRYWGFVPEDHVVGKPIMVWLSLDKDKSFFSSIRWNRFFKWVKSE